MTTTSSRPPGSDTREAAASATVKAAAVAAFLIAGVGYSAAVGASLAFANRVEALSGAVWIAVALAVVGLATSLLAWRLTVNEPDSEPGRASRGSPSVWIGDILPGASIAVLSLMATMSSDWAVSTMSLLFIPPLSGWMIATAARSALESVVVRVRPAAMGIVTVSASAGLFIAAHIVSQGRNDGATTAGRWAFGYSMLATVILAIGQRVARPRVDPHVVAGTLKEESPSALSLKNLQVSFRDRVILQDVSLDADTGELLALIGSNGAGKSSLLRAAAGALRPTTGTVFLRGLDVTGLTTEERMRMGLAFVSGAHPVFPDLSVLENLRVAAFHIHRRRSTFDATTERILDLVPHLQGRLASKAGVLSGGEQRLLALAQTLYQGPSVLLVDELTMGLDQDARALVLDLLRLLADGGMAVVAVDHDLDALLDRADAAVAIVAGRLEVHRPPDRALESHRELIPVEFLAGVNQ